LTISQGINAAGATSMGLGTRGQQHRIFDGDDDPKEGDDEIARVIVWLVRPTRRSCSNTSSSDHLG
jgi:hypothetical protein